MQPSPTRSPRVTARYLYVEPPRFCCWEDRCVTITICINVYIGGPPRSHMHTHTHTYTYSHWVITNTIIGIYTYTCMPEGGLGGCRVARETE